MAHTKEHTNVSEQRTTMIRHDDARLDGRDSFGLTDERGRAIGAVWYILPVTLVAADESARGASYGGHAPGSYAIAYVQTARDGVRFGALQTEHICASLEAARDKVQALIEASRQRYARRASRQPSTGGR